MWAVWCQCEVVQTQPSNGSCVFMPKTSRFEKLLLFAVTVGSGFPGKYAGLNIIATIKST